MKIEQNRWTPTKGWGPDSPGRMNGDATLVLLFGDTAVLKDQQRFNELRNAYPGAHLLGCSTAGEICDTQVTDKTLVATAVHFEHTTLQGASAEIKKIEDSFQVGERLATSLSHEGLTHVFVLSDGLRVNGSELVKGLAKKLPHGTSITGGLSGDGDRFKETLVLWDSAPAKDTVAVIGFYGNRLRVGYGSLGGWDPFGPERLITRSEGNVLYALDGQSALQLYKKYLGEHAKGLPATGLLFPLSIKLKGSDTPIVRTILSVDENNQSLTFAGDVPEGAYACLMKANFDRLIDGAVSAAKTSHIALGEISADLAILISCVGRKLVLRQRIEEEVEGVRDILGDHTVLAGFYSYGEISPFTPNAKCELHNQTMTITTFAEV